MVCVPIWLPLCLIVSGLAVEYSGFHTQDTAHRPNIILVMADDHGWGDTGYHGHPFALTPHLDQMSREGIRFDRWYAAAPVCSPTRGSCLTGRHPSRYGIYSANVGRLKPEEVCLAELLSEQGYATGHFGKWHLGTLTTKVKDANRGGPGSEDVYSPPWENGFDACFSTESKVPTFDPMKNPSRVSREAKRGVGTGKFYGTRYWTGVDSPVDFSELSGDDSRLIMDRAVAFLRRAVADQKPFFLVVWFHAPHTPVVADQSHRDLYPEHPHGEYGQHYHGCITAMDEQIGRLRAELDQVGQSENTMLWYASDNGPESSATNGAGSAGTFRGRKRSLLEGGIRVPATLVWPARISRPFTTEVPCVTSDYFPTIVDALNLEMPNRPYDGISLMPLIDGQPFDRTKPIGFQFKNQVALMNGRFKIYSDDKGQSWQLFDLQQDPQESKDLSEAMPEQRADMIASVQEWIASCGASDNGMDYDASAAESQPVR